MDWAAVSQLHKWAGCYTVTRWVGEKVSRRPAKVVALMPARLGAHTRLEEDDREAVVARPVRQKRAQLGPWLGQVWPSAF
jgi:hypothetical protein